MYKVSADYKLYCERRIKKHNKRSVVSKRKQLVKRRLHSRYKVSVRTNKYGDRLTRLALPAVFSLEDNYEVALEFINAFRVETSEESHNVYVDFTTLKKIHSDAALMLAAELDRWRRLKGIKLRVKRLKKWDHGVKRQLCEMGLFDLLEVSGPQEGKRDGGNDTVYIKFSTHNLAEGSYARELRENIEELSNKSIQGKRYLFNGLSEAMTNVMHHAYPERGNYLFEPILNQWWMTGSVNKSKNSITAVFFDQGVGIPESLPSTYPIERIQEFISKIGLLDSDASRIKAAMNLGRTSTEQTNRGRGLVNIRSFVANSSNARLRIMSGKGEYVFNSDGSEKLIRHNQSIGGTLIQWIVYS